jgi:hypothetical protein
MTVHKILVFVLSLVSFLAVAQPAVLVKPNEELIFGFTTEKGKHVVLAKEKGNDYIVYRFGTKDKIELEYPKQHKGSWETMTGSHYMRGGTTDLNMELKYVFFTIRNYQYVVYENVMPDGRNVIGVRVYDRKQNIKKTDISGKLDTQEGDLSIIIDSDLIQHSEDTFD